jgi:HTH-type transcriptional regulator/antitoxin HigA
MAIKPIRTGADHERALRRIETLWRSPLGSPKGDELEVLVTLVEAYEERNFPVDLPDPLEAIRFRLEQKGKDLSALVGVVGQRTRVYEVMRGDRPLSLQMIRNLHDRLGIPAEVLLKPVRKRAKKFRTPYRKSA